MGSPVADARTERAVRGTIAVLAGGAAILGATFGLLLRPPTTTSCTTSLPPGGYADLLVPLHLLAALAVAGCLVWISAARTPGGRPSGDTQVGLAIVAVYAGLGALVDGVFFVAMAAGLVLALPVLGVLVAIAVWRRRVVWLQALLWCTLVIGVPGHLAAAWLRGASLFCF